MDFLAIQCSKKIYFYFWKVSEWEEKRDWLSFNLIQCLCWLNKDSFQAFVFRDESLSNTWWTDKTLFSYRASDPNEVVAGSGPSGKVSVYLRAIAIGTTFLLGWNSALSGNLHFSWYWSDVEELS